MAAQCSPVSTHARHWGTSNSHDRGYFAASARTPPLGSSSARVSPGPKERANRPQGLRRPRMAASGFQTGAGPTNCAWCAACALERLSRRRPKSARRTSACAVQNGVPRRKPSPPLLPGPQRNGDAPRDQRRKISWATDAPAFSRINSDRRRPLQLP